MKQKCDVCKHWNLINNGYGLGRCNKIQEKIEVELDLGWDGGSVKYIETEADFGCNLFEDLRSEYIEVL